MGKGPHLVRHLGVSRDCDWCDPNGMSFHTENIGIRYAGRKPGNIWRLKRDEQS